MGGWGGGWVAGSSGNIDHLNPIEVEVEVGLGLSLAISGADERESAHYTVDMISN